MRQHSAEFLKGGHVAALLELAHLNVQVGNTDRSCIAMLEVCCSQSCKLSIACQQLGIPYVGITGNAETLRVFRQANDQVQAWVHVHVSTPCASGSPLKHFPKPSLMLTMPGSS